MSQDNIRFVHRGQIVSVRVDDPTTSVLSWLRERAHCMGTKEGCNEGDCGACTVIVGELVDAPNEHDGSASSERHPALRLLPVNACIQFLPTLHGKALLTVEDLQGQHPAQHALVACHGSQCGFCTPGFVMTLAALHQRHGLAGTQPTRAALADELSGNLCRCTGYRPILDAGQKMFEQPAPAIDSAPILAALLSLRAEPALSVNGYRAPCSLDELAELVLQQPLQQPQARLLAGGTDIGVWVNKQFRDLGNLIYLGRVTELQGIERRADALQIGAGASLTDAWDALAQQWPALREMGLRFASPPVRNAGTVGGNLANGSPIGDCAPVLMALGASLLLRRGGATRSVPLDDFYTGYLTNRLQPGEFVQTIVVPVQAEPAPSGTAADQPHNQPLDQPRSKLRTHLRAYKLSKRFDSDISGLAAGLWLCLDGAIVVDARFAFGGMAACVQRATQAEAAVRGQPWSQATARAAMTALDADFQPLSDLRASASYRQRAARNLLQRFWLETRTNVPLAADDVSVWAPR